MQKRQSIFTAFLIPVLLLSIQFCAAQKHTYSNQLQLEALGPGSLFSVNLDARFARQQESLGFRIGVGGSALGTLGKSCNRGTLITLPIGLNYLVGNQKHLLELGAGVVPSLVGGTKVYCIDFEHSFFSDDTVPYTYVLAGYRFHPKNQNRFSYRAFVSPLFQSGYSAKFWGGVSLGIGL